MLDRSLMIVFVLALIVTIAYVASLSGPSLIIAYAEPSAHNSYNAIHIVTSQSTGSLIPIDTKDPYGRPPRVDKVVSYTIRFVVQDPHGRTIFHTVHAVFKVYAQIYKYVDSDGKTIRIIVEYEIYKDYSDHSGLSREFISYVGGFNIASYGLYSPGVPDGWVLPVEGTYYDRGSSQWAISAGLNVDIFVVTVSYSSSVQGNPYTVSNMYIAGHGSDHTIGLFNTIVRTGDKNNYTISLTDRNALPIDYQKLKIIVAYSSVSSDGSTLLPALVFAGVDRIDHNYCTEWQGIGYFWEPHPYKEEGLFPVFSYYVTNNS